MRTGRRFAIDVGKARIGVAMSDQDGLLAVPFDTISRADSLVDAVQLVVDQTIEYEPLEYYVGLPLNLAGKPTPSTHDALQFARSLSERSGLPVFLIDERLTTVSAASNLREAGKNSKNGRAVIDQEAARLILEQALSIERRTGKQPGVALGEVEDL